MTYRFARFSLNADTRQLLAEGLEIHLSPKAFELLLCLTEHRSRAMSKAELQERLWPSTFVSETNLATLISEIRRALGDSAHDAKIVRTVQRFGYRFVAEVVDPVPSRIPSDARVRMSITSTDREFLLAEGANLIGRGHDAVIQVNSGSISRQHARIVVTGNQACVEDLGSKNGTFVDGRQITGVTPLRDGAEIRVGVVVFTFRATPTTQATETVG